MKRLILTLAALLVPATLPAQDMIDTDILMQDLRILAADDMAGRATGTPGGERARDYIERRFRALGLEVRRTPFLYPQSGRRTGQGANVSVLIRGSERPDKLIVVSAHYDHVGIERGQIHNGADDNASGVAALFAVAAALKRAPPRHSVVLIAFDAEEIGFHGARTFIQRPPVPVDNILLNINLDMISRRDGGGIVWAVGPRLYPALRPHIAAAAAAAPVTVRFGRDVRPPRGGPDPDNLTLRSDHGIFGLAHIPFVLFHTGEHDDYHQPTDDADRVDADYYRDVVALVLDSLRRLDANGAALDAARRQARRVRL